MNDNTDLGMRIREEMTNGKDLSDDLVLGLLQDKFNSPECENSGYIIDDFPTSSEKSLTISKQLDIMKSSKYPPDYVINVQVSKVVE